MLIHHFKVAWRNLVKNPMPSIINTGGLGISIAVVIMIGLWIHDEFAFNSYHKNYDRIAQVMQHQHFDDGIHTDKAIPLPLGTTLHSNYGTMFKYVVLSSWTNAHLLASADKVISAQGNYMEQDGPDMLSLRMISGSSAVLQDPSSILLSSSVSAAFFGSGNAVGKMIRLDGDDLRVGGIYEDLPDNSSFHDIAFIAPWKLYMGMDDTKRAGAEWNQNSFQLFVQVVNGRKMADVSADIKDVKLKALGPDGAQLKPQVFLQPMSRWHLYGEFKNGVNTGGAIQYVWMFAVIGIFVLLLACINFMNLSTARSEKRAKEVGIRKAAGSLRSQLIGQFYVESMLTAMVGVGISLLLVQLALPLFGSITGKEMNNVWSSPLFWLLMVCCILFTGIMGGTYPAFYLSSFKPVKILKGTFKAGPWSTVPRKMLVVVQFTASVAMITGTVVVYRQIQFARHRSIGYDVNGLVIYRPYSDDLHVHFNALRADLINAGVVTEVAESSNSITKGSRTAGGLRWAGKDPQMHDEFTTVAVSSGYGRTVGWQFVEGRDFISQSLTDSNALIINESAARYMGLRHPVGQRISWDKTYTIVGVIKDIVMTSPYEPVKQAVYYVTSDAGYLNFRIAPRISAAGALARIEAVCKKYSPATPFDYKFADAEYARKFRDEERIGQLAILLASLAIFISCIGLFGLASYVAEQRTREIGIRKVLGASLYNLWSLQSREFLVLVMISFLIASPVAYFFMHKWLENYHYRVELSYWIFAAAGATALIISMVTVSFQSIRVAMSNPVKSLRTE